MFLCGPRQSEYPDAPVLLAAQRSPRRRSGPIADRVPANPSSFLQLFSRRHIGRTFHFAFALNAEAGTRMSAPPRPSGMLAGLCRQRISAAAVGGKTARSTSSHALFGHGPEHGEGPFGDATCHKPGAPGPSRGIRATIVILLTLSAFPSFAVDTLTKYTKCFPRLNGSSAAFSFPAEPKAMGESSCRMTTKDFVSLSGVQ